MSSIPVVMRMALALSVRIVATAKIYPGIAHRGLPIFATKLTVSEAGISKTRAKLLSNNESDLKCANCDTESDFDHNKERKQSQQTLNYDFDAIANASNPESSTSSPKLHDQYHNEETQEILITTDLANFQKYLSTIKHDAFILNYCAAPAGIGNRSLVKLAKDREKKRVRDYTVPGYSVTDDSESGEERAREERGGEKNDESRELSYITKPRFTFQYFQKATCPLHNVNEGSDMDAITAEIRKKRFRQWIFSRFMAADVRNPWVVGKGTENSKEELHPMPLDAKPSERLDYGFLWRTYIRNCEDIMDFRCRTVPRHMMWSLECYGEAEYGCVRDSQREERYREAEGDYAEAEHNGCMNTMCESASESTKIAESESTRIAKTIQHLTGRQRPKKNLMRSSDKTFCEERPWIRPQKGLFENILSRSKTTKSKQSWLSSQESPTQDSSGFSTRSRFTNANVEEQSVEKMLENLLAFDHKIPEMRPATSGLEHKIPEKLPAIGIEHMTQMRSCERVLVTNYRNSLLFGPRERAVPDIWKIPISYFFGDESRGKEGGGSSVKGDKGSSVNRNGAIESGDGRLAHLGQKVENYLTKNYFGPSFSLEGMLDLDLMTTSKLTLVPKVDPKYSDKEPITIYDAESSKGLVLPVNLFSKDKDLLAELTAAAVKYDFSSEKGATIRNELRRESGLQTAMKMDKAFREVFLDVEEIPLHLRTKQEQLIWDLLFRNVLERVMMLDSEESESLSTLKQMSFNESTDMEVLSFNDTDTEMSFNDTSEILNTSEILHTSTGRSLNITEFEEKKRNSDVTIVLTTILEMHVESYALLECLFPNIFPNATITDGEEVTQGVVQSSSLSRYLTSNFNGAHDSNTSKDRQAKRVGPEWIGKTHNDPLIGIAKDVVNAYATEICSESADKKLYDIMAKVLRSRYEYIMRDGDTGRKRICRRNLG